MKKKILCLLLALLVINLSIPHVAWATESIDGYCGAEGDGKSVQWKLDSDGTLTISGSGKMKDYDSSITTWSGYQSSIKSVIIKSGVTSIGENAFRDCSNLQSVTIPEGVTSIGENAFSCCSNLQSVTIPGSVTSIGNYVFELCRNLQSVTIPESVTSIGAFAFSSCASLQSVTIPESVTSIGENAFSDCSNLQSVTIPEKVTSIGTGAFSDCSNLQSVTIPEKVTSIGTGAFSDCSNLQSVTIPEKVTSIGTGAFSDCSNLQSVTIPEKVTSIGNSVFEGCDSLKTVFYKEGLNIESAGLIVPTVGIAYNVHDQQDGSRTKVKLVSTSENVTIKCDAMGDRYEIIDNSTTSKFEKVTIEHYLPDDWNKGDGEKHWRVCTVCGAKEAFDHEWNAGTVTKNPTCTDAGSKKLTCNACGATKDETIKAAGHTFSPEWSSDDTHHWHKCEICGAEDTKVGHDFSGPWEYDEGRHWKKCKDCGAEGTKFEHTFEQKSGEGKHWEECNVCHEKQNEGQHTFEQKSDSTEHWKVCSICKKETDKASHSFSKVIFAPKEDKLGGTKYTCTCGYEYWKDFKRDNMVTQIFMPDKEEIHLYCERNGLMVKAEVYVGGKKLEVFLLDPLGVLKENDSDVLGISVTYVEEGLARYNELMSLLDGDYPIEHINFFEVLPTVNGKIKDGPIDSVYMMYEIPEGWDESDLEMILVQNGDDQEFDEKVVEMNGKKYLVMWKNHFSPYAMIDKLTDEERAALISQQVESMGSASSSGSTDDSKYLANQVKTGDNSKNMVLMSTAMLITSGLFLEICIKRKRFCYKILID